ncbi:MAG TPA: carboxypeptidase-like regulatory domain-containing protein [Candidatus Acidoferrum sp.]
MAERLLRTESFTTKARRSMFGAGCIGLLCLTLNACPVRAQSWQLPNLEQQNNTTAIAVVGVSASQQPAEQQSPGRISGNVVDRTGVAIARAKVTLTRDGQPSKQETLCDNDGQYSFADVPPGLFHLTITAEGFAAQNFSGTLHPGEIDIVPQIVLVIATAITEIRVEPPQEEIAEAQIKEQEKQRALGFIPNFYVSYIPNAAPLNPKQKFELAWKSLVDPVNFGLTGAVAGIQQGRDDFHGYGQGVEGYAKRYGAAYMDGVTGTLIGSAILPSLLKQDPRYFYKGTGTVRSRFMYAVANSVICKGDNGHWQPNYSAIAGGIAAGGISNLYYPATDRNGVELTFENALLGIGASAAANILQEFVIKKVTPNLPNHDPGKTLNNISRLVLGPFVREGE